MAGEVSVNVDTFLSRLQKLQATVQSHSDIFGGATVLQVLHGRPLTPGGEEPHSVSIQKHLLGYEFPDTIILISQDAFYMHASQKKLDYLRPSADAAVARKLSTGIQLIVREKGDINQPNIETLLGVVRAAEGPLGTFPNDFTEGSAAAEAWIASVRSTGKPLVDATRGIELVFAVKDDEAVLQVTKAGHLVSRMARNVFVKTMEEIIDEDKKTTNAQLAETVESAVDKLDDYKIKVDTEIFDVMVKPVVQSGGTYNVHVAKGDVSSSNSSFAHDTIIFSLGMKYKSHGAFLARTFFVDPTPQQNLLYSALLDAQLELIDKLRPGAKISDVVTSVRDAMLSKDGMPLDAKMTKNFGTGFGLRSTDKHLILSTKNETVVEDGMVFVVSIGLSEIPLKDATNPSTAMAKLATYAILLSDTIVVRGSGNEVVTDKISKEKSEVTYVLADDQEDKIQIDLTTPGARSTRLAAKKADMELDNEARKRREEHQKLLFEKKKDLARRGGASNAGAGAEHDELAGAGIIEAYKSSTEYPRGIRPCQISVDKAHDAVLLPMFGTLVPFHISTIKSVVKSEEGHKTFLRFNFFAPGQAPGKEISPSMLAALTNNGESIFVRTLNFMSRDQRNMNNVLQLIKTMQKKLKTERDAEKQRADLIEQPKLVITKDAKVPRLQDLNMWPAISGRKTRGTLEAHTNGLRFISDKGEKVEIIYSNIRHGIFQPCEKEHIVLVHFHLKHAIMIGRKKFKDVQFFTEVVESSVAIDGRHRSDFDADELADEERERRMRNEMNKAFRRFVERVQEIAERDPGGFRSFDIPTTDLTFTGAPNREMVNITPCTDCLVSLADKPPFVVSVDDIDHVHFERVSFANKDFDMVLIFKAGTREKGEDEFIRIVSIPRGSLDMLKSWLDEVAELTYTEGVAALGWKGLIEEYARVDGFWDSNDAETGESKPVGWTFLLDDDEEAAEEDEDEESVYEDDDDEDEDEEDDDEDDDEFDGAVTDEDDDDADFGGDDDEDGDDWDELDRKADASDKKRKREDEEKDAARAKRDKHAKKPRTK